MNPPEDLRKNFRNIVLENSIKPFPSNSSVQNKQIRQTASPGDADQAARHLKLGNDWEKPKKEALLKKSTKKLLGTNLKRTAEARNAEEEGLSSLTAPEKTWVSSSPLDFVNLELGNTRSFEDG
ncbi:Uncharacterized protein Rs2_34251 [Raphanus sativus]|nr:Uncharacterized protein Rs2_34251 [Raphanus sativus]